ncbi:MAG: DUF169 domain-containing protein [Candidatus Nitrosopolaris sp.]
MSKKNWKLLDSELTSLLNLQSSPVAITFSNATPEGTQIYEDNIPKPTSDGRTGKVPAGCVFWMKASNRTFTTLPEDHANCSVGSVTHGLKTIDEVLGNSDVACLLESGWVNRDMFSKLPVVGEHFNFITYGPLKETNVDPDVILLRINAMQAMVLHDAIPGLRIEGKPQCHIVAVAKEQKDVAMSVGCKLSRVRTGMLPTEMSCAIPASRLAEVVTMLTATRQSDNAVARYASEDSLRFKT